MEDSDLVAFVQKYPLLLDPSKRHDELWRVRNLRKKLELLKEIVILRYECKMTLQAIGKIKGVSRQAIEQLLDKYGLK